jgi:hypothetical protein
MTTEQLFELVKNARDRIGEHADCCLILLTVDNGDNQSVTLMAAGTSNIFERCGMALHYAHKPEEWGSFED